MKRRHIWIIAGVELLLVLCLLINAVQLNIKMDRLEKNNAELKALFSTSLSYTTHDSTGQPPLPIIVHFTDIDGNESTMHGTDETIFFDNKVLEVRFKEFVASHRESHYECPCNKPEFWIEEKEDSATLRASWREFFQFSNLDLVIHETVG